jgi:2-polyprenyl-6-methoxyphenol hydroxylase-like FAD-dependent oxidoreductase
VSVRQDESKAWVEAQGGQENGEGRRETLEADYVIGCDGATSRVRQELFGREWPAVTWDCALMVQNVGQQSSFYPLRSVQAS